MLLHATLRLYSDWCFQKSSLLRHSDVFKEYIWPQIQLERDEWDNLSNNVEYSEQKYAALSDQDKASLSPAEIGAPNSSQLCRAVCERQQDCLQYSYISKKCSLSKTLTLGHQHANTSEPMHSGWITARIKMLFEDLDKKCGTSDWFLP